MPALLLPVVAGTVVIVAQENSVGIERGVGGLILLVYLFVLLGSMTLNAWLLLRHPHTLSTRALPRSSSIVLVALWALLVVWSVLLALPARAEGDDWFSLVFAFVGIVLSIMSFILAAARGVAAEDRVPLENVEFGTSARVGLWIYVTAAGIAILAYVAFSLTGSSLSSAGSIIGGPATWALIVLGLPWSHPLYFVSVLGALTVDGGAVTVFASVTPVLAVCANIALALVMLLSPTHRTRIINWFFRLKAKPARIPAPAPPL